MLSRRRVIGLGGAAAAGWALSSCDAAGVTGPVPSEEPSVPAGSELTQPQILDSRDGRLAVTLTAAPGAVLAGRRTSALGFNGTSPGPTLRVRPGDELAVRLVNRLDSPTNLHTHGLRVSPSGNGDNPFVRVEPGGHFDYLIRIPPGHPPGTHWYHPHLHHLVADQLYGGLMGAIVVAAPQEPAFDADRVLLLSDITLDAAGAVLAPGPMEKAMGRQGELLLVNGADGPQITVPTGTAQRWRIVNACTSRILELTLTGPQRGPAAEQMLTDHQMMQLALDGSYLPAPVPRQRVRLAPGNRVDVLVTPAAPGRFALVADTMDRGGMGMMRAGSTGRRTVATMVCPPGERLLAPAPPVRLPAEQPPGGAVTARRNVELQMTMGMGMGMDRRGMGMSFAIDGREFDAARDDQTTSLGTVEEWTVTNPGPMVHPFHLHAWPFTVLESSDGSPPAGVPQDVVEVPARGWVRLRVPFTGVSGRSVYHCHILDHEDLGMMATVHVRG